MSIIYALIAKQTQTQIINLCSYDSAHGNYPQITNEILNNIKIKESVTYRYNEEYNYHILKDGILIFVCLAESSMKLKICFGFLEQIKKRFRQKYSNQQILQAKTYDMSTSFAQTFKNQMTYYNSSRDQDKKQVLMKQLSSLQEIMSENIDKVLQREEKVQILVKKTAKLDSIADEIKKSASKIKKQSLWAKHKVKLLIGGLVAIGIIALIIVL